MPQQSLICVNETDWVMVAHQTADRHAVDSYHLHTTEIPVKTGDLQHAHLGIVPKCVSVSDSYSSFQPQEKATHDTTVMSPRLLHHGLPGTTEP